MAKHSNSQLAVPVRAALWLIAGVVLGVALTLVVMLASLSPIEVEGGPGPSPLPSTQPSARSIPAAIDRSPESQPTAPPSGREAGEKLPLPTTFPIDPELFPDHEAWFSEGVRTPSADDLAHGETQLRTMLLQRPAMAEYIEEGDILWQWTVRQFAGAHLPTTISWMREDPEGGVESDCQYWPESDPQAYIRVRRVWGSGEHVGDPKSFDRLWCDAVYELLNIRDYETFNRLHTEALAGRIDREAWFRGNFRQEYEAGLLLRDFYHDIWRPYCLANSIGSDAHQWWAHADEAGFDEWFRSAQAEGTESSVWYNYWMDAWERTILPHRANGASFRPAQGSGR